MDLILIVLAVIVAVAAFYGALRAYTRRQIARGRNPTDTD